MGIGQTSFAKHLPGSETEPAAQAHAAATLADANISPDEVDGLVSYTIETTSDVDLARNLGFGEVGFFAQVGYGGGAGCGAVGLRRWRWRRASVQRRGRCRAVAQAWRGGDQPWVQAGLGVPEAPGGIPQRHRLVPRRGDAASRRPDRDAGAALHARVRRHTGAPGERRAHSTARANHNPNAVMYERPLTRDEYMESR